MAKIKGVSSLPPETILKLVFGLMVAIIISLILFPGIAGAETAAECGGIVRKSASVLANKAGINIC